AAVTMPAAKARPYALTVHSSVARPARSSRCMAGSAVITTSESSATMKNAMDVSASVQRGDERRAVIGSLLRESPGVGAVGAALTTRPRPTHGRERPKSTASARTIVDPALELG